MIRKESGFTILELLLVLSIVMIMTAIVIPIGGKWMAGKEEDDAIQSIVLSIHSLQSYALAHGVRTRLKFQSEGDRTMYIASAPGRVEFSRKLLPDGMRISAYSSLKAVEFRPDGDIIDLGKLIFVGKSGHTHITFQFQRGRMIISEPVRFLMARNHSNSLRVNGNIWYTSSIRNKNDDTITRQEVSYARC